MLHIHLVSDSTGETVHQAARAAISQFQEAEVEEHIWTLVRSKEHVDIVEKSLEKKAAFYYYRSLTQRCGRWLSVLAFVIRCRMSQYWILL